MPKGRKPSKIQTWAQGHARPTGNTLPQAKTVSKRGDINGSAPSSTIIYGGQYHTVPYSAEDVDYFFNNDYPSIEESLEMTWEELNQLMRPLLDGTYKKQLRKNKLASFAKGNKKEEHSASTKTTSEVEDDVTKRGSSIDYNVQKTGNVTTLMHQIFTDGETPKLLIVDFENKLSSVPNITSRDDVGAAVDKFEAEFASEYPNYVPKGRNKVEVIVVKDRKSYEKELLDINEKFIYFELGYKKEAQPTSTKTTSKLEDDVTKRGSSIDYNEQKRDDVDDEEWHDDETHGGFNPSDPKCKCTIS